MPALLNLEDFLTNTISRDPSEQEAVPNSEEFERGYNSGWADANENQQQKQETEFSELVRNLQDMTFTFYEAKAQIMNDLRPLFSEILDKTLPELTSKTYIQELVDKIEAGIASQHSPKIHVELCAADHSALIARLDQHSDLPVEFHTTDHLQPGQVHLSIGDREHLFDAPDILKNLEDSIEGFFSLNERAV